MTHMRTRFSGFTTTANTEEDQLKKPWGWPPKVNERFFVELSDYDRRLVGQLCHVMNVGHSELFHILLTGSLQMAAEINGREMEAVQ